MRVEFSSVAQSQVESAKTIDKKEIKGGDSTGNTALEESSPFIGFSLGSGRTYSLSSLKAAVDHHAKFLTVAESNMAAVNHAAVIPRELLDSLIYR
jgi:ATP-dependent protease HslVU (ClpYQ) peptidase subunit